MAQFREFYKKEVISVLTQQFGYDNPMRVPKITKVVLNMGVGEAVSDKKVLDSAAADLTQISGQKVVITKARKSIAGFKIREGWPIGCKVTLRGERMYEFLERLVGIAIPRIRDFRGLSPKSFDGRGNYAMGVNEQIIFPEVDYDKIDKLRGMDITITTTAKNDDEGRALLTAMRFPFRGSVPAAGSADDDSSPTEEKAPAVEAKAPATKEAPVTKEAPAAKEEPAAKEAPAAKEKPAAKKAPAAKKKAPAAAKKKSVDKDTTAAKEDKTPEASKAAEEAPIKGDKEDS